MKNKSISISRSKATIPFLLALCIGLSACKKFLDAKPDKQLATPTSLADLQAILDSDIRNTIFASAGDVASDDYFLPAANWSALASLNARNDYIWYAQAANDQDWQYGYADIESANVVLDGLGTFPKTNSNAADYNNAKGSALFFRGYSLAQLLDVFTQPYDAANAAALPGLPVRLSSDITLPATRSTMAATYSQVISDLKQASALLPVTPLIETRPSKLAAFGALARLYLTMGDYQDAKAYADSSLQLNSTLIDYNTLNTNASTPFLRFNAETIFYGTSSGLGGALAVKKARVDTLLYGSYDNNDLRKQLYYAPATGGYFSFKGSYSGVNSSTLFAGVATDETLLIRAESSARLGDAADAISDLNLLLKNRWRTGTYIPYAGSLPADSALSLIISERRKELAFRSELRWSDLRRYSSDSRFATTPQRFLNGQLYTLPPGDKRYAFLLPVSVVQLSGIAQNER